MTVPHSQGDPPPNAGWEAIVSSIGPKLRELRQQFGLSLQHLASRSGVSAAAIHKVERGDMVPTITTLLKLAAALGRPLTYFVDDAVQEQPPAVHIRASERPAPPADWAPEADGIDAAALAMPNARLRGAAVHAIVPPGGTGGAQRALRAGEQLLLVLEGRLSVDVAGAHYEVETGDTLHYPTDLPHHWHNPGPAPARAVWWWLRG
jgi:transcriptional regulator with XRE-family HTH domain